MFKVEFDAMASVTKLKVNLLDKNPMGYFLASFLAGIYIGLGILFIYCLGASIIKEPYVRILMSAAFSIALSLVIFAGGELFTGNAMVVSAGLLNRTSTLPKILKMMLVCYLGNWLGSIFISVVFWATGLLNGDIISLIGTASLSKTSLTVEQLFFRGVLCNLLVCLAIWCSFKNKSESAKLIMIFWCVFAFNMMKLEHSIANMALLTLALLTPIESSITIYGYFYNILWVSLGNLTGAVLLLTLPYYLISADKQ